MSAELSPKTYALTPALRARLMASALVVIALVLLAATLLVAALHLNTAVMLVLVILVPVTIAILASLLSRRFYVLRIDDLGYQSRFVGAVGAKQARWVDVLDLGVVTIEDARCAQFRLRDGRTTTIPVDLLQTDPEELIREFQRRLTAASGRKVGG
ncbi:MAG: hypothetical protein ACTHOG_09010 [Marmoricola sp.]